MRHEYQALRSGRNAWLQAATKAPMLISAHSLNAGNGAWFPHEPHFG
ncbi:hypothetical protein THIX_50027 [Thiomonas sp. X19]|nr:hypothetical protein THIX_30911 [Thiomonas sp. X19]SCC93841.1 hypothetical protein THIX_50027 [Thiomonas sp. X19]